MSLWTTLPMAKRQVGIPFDDYSNDDLLNSLLERAERMVLEYVSNDTVADEPTPPDPLIAGAIYLQFAEVWRFRGDDVDGDGPASRIPGALSPQVERCILKRRLPSLG